MIPEAPLSEGAPQSPGWFVVNAKDAPWFWNELGGYCGFERRDRAAFEELGVNLNLLTPGMPMAMYHEEPGQEGFLVLRGECLLIVEGEQRPLRTWDFFHCPPHTKHTIVGAGDEPALVLAVGARKGAASYPVEVVAVELGAGVEREGLTPAEAYAKYSKLQRGSAPELT